MAKKILIAEDDALLRGIIKKKISDSGYEAIAAADGEEAIRLVTEKKPDVLVLDIVMPKKNGFEVMEELNRLGILPITVVISNSGDVIDTGRAYKLGAKDSIIKAHFEPDDILDRVEKLIGPAPAKESSVLKDGNSKSVRVLFVEDEPFIRDLVVAKLKMENFDVLVAGDGESALELIEREKDIDLILLDIILPGMSGFEVLQKIKRQEQLKSIPVIILSNLGQKSEIEQGLKLGAEKFFVKSNLLPDEMIQAINDVLSGKGKSQ